MPQPLYIVLVVILILLVVGMLPGLPLVNHGWGYGPSGLLGLVLVVVVVLLLLGRL